MEISDSIFAINEDIQIMFNYPVTKGIIKSRHQWFELYSVLTYFESHYWLILSLVFILEHYVWVSPLLLIVALALIPAMWYISHRNVYTHSVLYSGWTPVIGAMVISRLALFIVFYW